MPLSHSHTHTQSNTHISVLSVSALQGYVTLEVLMNEEARLDSRLPETLVLN